MKILFLLFFSLVSVSISAVDIGKITFVMGQLEVKEAGGVWQKAATGKNLTEKMKLNTGIKSSAVIQFKNGNLLKIKAGTLIDLEKVTTSLNGDLTNVSLYLGSVTAIVLKQNDSRKHNQFRVRTPTAVAGVRGTIEEISYYPDLGTTVNLLESSAEIISALGESSIVQEDTSAETDHHNRLEDSSVTTTKKIHLLLLNSTMSDEERRDAFHARDPRIGMGRGDFERIRRFILQKRFNIHDNLRIIVKEKL